MRRKWIAALLSMVLLLSLAACGDVGGKNTTAAPMTDATTATPPGTTQAPEVYDITIWVPIGYVEMTQKQIEQFNADHAGQYRFEAEVVAEPEAIYKIRYQGVPAPDLFCFTTENEVDLVAAYGLTAPLSDQAAQAVTENHHAAAVAAAARDGRVYAYPLSFAPSTVMFYDKSVLSQEDIGSLEALIAACEASGRKISFGQPTHSFFSATGCVSDWTFDEEGQWVSVHDTYNSPEGLIALEHLRELLQSPCHWDGNSPESFQWETPSAVVIGSPQHLYEQAKAILGENLGVAQLPSFEHAGKSYQLMTDSYCHLLGISPQADGERLAALEILARYLTDEACQLQRYEEFGLLPSNLQTQQAVAQEQSHWQTVWDQPCTARRCRHGSWWDFSAKLASNVLHGMPLEQALRSYEWSVKDILKVYTWSVIGGFPDANWTVHFYMEKQPDGTYRTEEALYFEENTEFKILYQRRWDINYGADGQLDGPNIKPGVTGYFYVVFDPETCLCRLEPQ